jgi:hypothetical protein
VLVVSLAGTLEVAALEIPTVLVATTNKAAEPEWY